MNETLQGEAQDMTRFGDGPILLDDPVLTIGELARLSGVPAGSIRNWNNRGVLPTITRAAPYHVRGSLADAIALRAVADLTERVRVLPSDAAGAAQLLARHVIEHAPKDASGRPIADPTAIPRTRAFVLATVGGEMHVGLIDPAQPGTEAAAGWDGACVLLPIAAIVAEVVRRFLEIATAE